MLTQTGMMQMARQAMSHATDRQLAVARNVANADTPGYRATDVAAFEPDEGGGVLSLKVSNLRHFGGDARVQSTRLIDAGGEASPNGNSVSLEDEMVRAATAKREHDLALTVYQSALKLTRTALGRRG